MSPQKTFLDYLSRNNMAATEQRRVVLEVFLNSSEDHYSSEELYMAVSRRDPGISQATVYRTVKLLADSGIAEPLDFGDGVTRYECKHDRHHHDHLICSNCGRQIEVLDEKIEELQEKLAARNGFTLARHKMILYGICKKCREQ